MPRSRRAGSSTRRPGPSRPSARCRALAPWKSGRRAWKRFTSVICVGAGPMPARRLWPRPGWPESSRGEARDRGRTSVRWHWGPTMYARLWWKEARTFWPIWLVLGVVALGLQGLVFWFDPSEARTGILIPQGLAWSVLYAFAVGSAAFAGEREANTQGFLDTL